MYNRKVLTGFNFQLNYPGGNFKNPFFTLYENSTGYMGESATMTVLLDSVNNDQRQTVYGADASCAASTLGIPVGIKYPDNWVWCEANPTYCYILHPDYREQDDPLYIITASQVLLARSEAADRGWTSEIANTNVLYQEGITQSFLQWGLSPPNDAYFNHVNVALPETPVTGTNIAQIVTQQYLAFYPNGVQGWSNWRKTGYPVLLPATDALNNPPTIPVDSSTVLPIQTLHRKVSRKPLPDYLVATRWSPGSGGTEKISNDISYLISFYFMKPDFDEISCQII